MISSHISLGIETALTFYHKNYFEIQKFSIHEKFKIKQNLSRVNNNVHHENLYSTNLDTLRGNTKYLSNYSLYGLEIRFLASLVVLDTKGC